MARNKFYSQYDQQTTTVTSDGERGNRSNNSEAFAEPTQDAIRQRAYMIFLARGSRPGSDLDDWTQAEQELRAINNRSRKA